MQLWRKFACLGALLAGDVLTLFLVFLACVFLRDGVIAGERVAGRPHPFPAPEIGTGFFEVAVILVLIFAYQKLYNRRFAFWEETKRLLEGVTLAFLVTWVIVLFFRPARHFSPSVLGLAWVLCLAAFPAVRILVKTALTRSGLWRKNILILGTGPTARRAAREIRRDTALGLSISGFLAERKGRTGRLLAGGIPVVGVVGDYRRLIAALNVREVVVALTRLRQDRIIRIVKACEPLVENIKFVPAIGADFTSGVQVDAVGDVLTLTFPRNLAKPWNRLFKHAFDFILSFLLLLAATPLFLMVAAAVKADSRGPVLFVQKRLGRVGREFSLYKFRSMHRDAPERLKGHFRSHPEALREWKKYQKLRGYDPRVTGVGRLLRSWSLDELPQVLNVLVGDMSLVGPRPYLPRESRSIGPTGEIISRVKPGLTGLWQVRGRNRLSFKERLALDEFYIRNWSPWLDIVILLQTLKVLVRREGAF
ncbi:MAG: undecaprenyl-phosphate galactose phosphotransferase WbaP [Candidatus Aminicenantes bacterium]|nr:undecaprenyl-phosphate galactose phosphotransferase WbaP [Candidatus Aminicenantes bacterium]